MTKLQYDKNKETHQLENLSVSGSRKLKPLRTDRRESVDWIHPFQGKYLWQTVINTVMNLEFHKRTRIF
jgi:hypothetical protein